MPTPATNGSFKTNMQDMAIGDYIAFKYAASSGAAGTFSDFGAALTTAQANEIPATGAAAPNGYAYALKVAPGLLICDRVLQHSISSDVLNAAKLIQGKSYGDYFYPSLTSNSSNGCTVTSSGEYSTYSAWKAFDGDTSVSGSWVGISYLNQYIAIDIGEIKRFFGISIAPTMDVNKLSTFEIYTSNDGINFSKIFSGSKSFIAGYEDFLFSSPQTSRNWKILLTGNPASNAYGGLADIRFIKSSVLIRSLTGGVAYLGADGLPKLADASLGAWPPVNEWDKYIVNSNLGGKITAGDDNVWHHKGLFSAVQETPIIGTYTNQAGVTQACTSAWRIIRGYDNRTDSKWLNLSVTSSNSPLTTVGFRPAFEFLETGAKASNLWY